MGCHYGVIHTFDRDQRDGPRGLSRFSVICPIPRAQETAVARASCPCRTLPWQFQEVVFLDSRLRGNDRFVSGHFPALQQRPPRVVLRRELPGRSFRQLARCSRRRAHCTPTPDEQITRFLHLTRRKGEVMCGVG